MSIKGQIESKEERLRKKNNEVEKGKKCGVLSNMHPDTEDFDVKRKNLDL